MRFKFKIPIGDWSADGHGKCEELVINCNYPVEAVQQAYKDSCQLTGVSFDHTDYRGRDWREADKYQVATGYLDCRITPEVEAIFREHGIEVRENDEYYGEYENEEDQEDREDVEIDGVNHFLELLMTFIKLSLPNLQYEVVNDGLPYLNGYWNDALNVQFGYGLFD